MIKSGVGVMPSSSSYILHIIPDTDNRLEHDGVLNLVDNKPITFVVNGSNVTITWKTVYGCLGLEYALETEIYTDTAIYGHARGLKMWLESEYGIIVNFELLRRVFGSRRG